uniref:Uncharacterized protein n=1 Tax=viral metagenome TaxID=1070528 RepID=A0A6C0JHB6_9ZZZZ
MNTVNSKTYLLIFTILFFAFMGLCFLKTFGIFEGFTEGVDNEADTPTTDPNIDPNANASESEPNASESESNATAPTTLTIKARKG